MLADFQHVGVGFLLAGLSTRDGPAVRWLCDQQGTGKTVQVAAAIGLRPWLPVVVTCPAGLRRNWRREIGRFARREVILAASAADAEEGARAVLSALPGPALVLSHDNLADALDAGAPALRVLLGAGALLVLDEVQRLKGRTSDRGRASRDAAALVRRGGGASWWLSATPMPQSPLDLWTLLTWSGLASTTFGTIHEFAQHFGGLTWDRGVSWVWPPKPPGGPARQLQGWALRRLRRDVMPELPPARVELRLVEVEGTSRRTLDAVARAAASSLGWDVERLASALDPETATVAAAEVMRRLGDYAEARKELAEAKVPALLRRVAELETSDAAFAVYSEHRAPVDALRGRPGWVVLTGDETDRQRALAVESFAQGEIVRGLKQGQMGDPVQGLAYTGAGREGHSLPRAERLLVVSSPWNSDDEEQAIDRLNRYGRVTAPTVEKIVAAHPVELLSQRVLATKRARNTVALGDAEDSDMDLSTPPDRSVLPYMSWTRLSAERDCQFASYCKYKLKIRPEQRSEHFRLGVLFDAAISARLRMWGESFETDGGRSAVSPAADDAARKAIREAVVENAWPQQRGSTEDDGVAAMALSVRALEAFGFLSGRWRPFFIEGRPAVQVDLRVPLTPHHTGWAGWQQINDLFAWDMTGGPRPLLGVLDFKCRSRALGKSLADGQNDPQLMLYMRGARALGIPVDIAARLEVRGKMPEEPRLVNKGKKLSVDKAAHTTPALFRAAIARHGFDPADYQEHVEWLEREGPRMHSIVQCGRVDGALDAVWQDMLYDAFEMQRHDRRPVRNLRTRGSSPCHSESWPCDYRDICGNTLNGFSTPDAYAETLVQLGRMRRSAHYSSADEREAMQEELG